MAVAQERWACPNCGTPLNIAALGIYAKVACPACGHIDHVHTMLANFRLEGVLGLGGMSVVLRARDLVLDRPLAIKLLNEFYRDQPERIARFEQECALMAKVRHENVVSVYSAGHAKGQFYIAMELVNGRNLEELVHAEGPMEPMRALDVLCQVVQGLDAAYKAGLLHRDMKPGNILICEDGHAKVLDFGLSLGLRDADKEEIIWATPYYVPPETLKGEAEDTRTDIYALGMTLRHLLTGRQNFEPAPEGIDEMLACKQELPPMADELPELPEAYCDLIDHMTAYEPDARPGGYAALLAEVDEVRAVLEAESGELSLATRVKRSLPCVAGTALTLALGAGAAALTSHLMTPEPELLYLSPATYLDWQERDLFATAMEKLQQGQLPDAAALLAELADSEGEPAACAWASVHGWVLASLQEDDAARGHFRERMAYHLSRTPVSAGQEMHGQMRSLLGPDSSPEDKFLQAVVGLKRLHVAIAQGQETAPHLQAVRRALLAVGDAYAPLVEELVRYEERLAARVAKPSGAGSSQLGAPDEGKAGESAPTEERYIFALARLNVQEAQRLLAALVGSAADDFARTRFTVQLEALALFDEAVKLLNRYSLAPAEGEFVSVEQLKTLVSPLGEPGLPDELATLLLVARGDFAAAAALNPYAQSPDSPEPFAVMMRDWLARVKK